MCPGASSADAGERSAALAGVVAKSHALKMQGALQHECVQRQGISATLFPPEQLQFSHEEDGHALRCVHHDGKCGMLNCGAQDVEYQHIIRKVEKALHDCSKTISDKNAVEKAAAAAVAGAKESQSNLGLAGMVIGSSVARLVGQPRRKADFL